MYCLRIFKANDVLVKNNATDIKFVDPLICMKFNINCITVLYILFLVLLFKRNTFYYNASGDTTFRWTTYICENTWDLHEYPNSTICLTLTEYGTSTCNENSHINSTSLPLPSASSC